MQRISPQTLDPFLLELSDKDPERRRAARKELASLEERGLLDTPLLVDRLFQSDINAQIYLLQTLGRKAEPRTFPFLDSFFAECRSGLVLVEALEVFAHVEVSDFEETVLNKLSVKPAKKVKKGKNKNPEKGDSDAMIRLQCTLPALKYLRKCATEKSVPFLKEMLGHRYPSVRFEALMTFHKRRLELEKSQIIAIGQSDESKLNRDLAEFILNPPPTIEDEDNAIN